MTLEQHQPPTLGYKPSPDCDCEGDCVTCARLGCDGCALKVR